MEIHQLNRIEEILGTLINMVGENNGWLRIVEEKSDNIEKNIKAIQNNVKELINGQERQDRILEMLSVKSIETDSSHALFETTGYGADLLEYCDENEDFHYQEWDGSKGFIYRSKRFDHRNKDGKLGFVSLIVDANKPLL